MDVEALHRPGGPDLRGAGRELHVLERALPAMPASTALARMTARIACRAWRVPQVADDGVLLASELVTAAVRATAGVRVVLRVLMTPRRLRIEAHDPSGRLVAAIGDGRVLAGRLPMDPVQQEVVRALTCRCGVDPSGPGSQAWGELALQAQTR